MYVELIYDKRNVAGLPGANEMIQDELTRRLHRVFPDAEVRVKPMMTLSQIHTDASKSDKSIISQLVQEMFEEADMWLTSADI
ncbi:virulence protein MsgA [Salmonella enterica subsp. enterica serovar Choleraesuis]|nr:virulence protein MsgA [Salmonella enterica subsp. enterica serovar Choleraesuis]